jgi:hypothetical protein
MASVSAKPTQLNTSPGSLRPRLAAWPSLFTLITASGAEAASAARTCNRRVVRRSLGAGFPGECFGGRRPSFRETARHRTLRPRPSSALVPMQLPGTSLRRPVLQLW